VIVLPQSPWDDWATLRLARPRPHALVVLLALAACHDFQLPPVPVLVVPKVTDLSPRAAFAGRVLEVTGENFDPVAENNEVVFTGGAIARADEATSTRLKVTVPEVVQSTGPVTVSTPQGRSEASPVDFVPLGYGHPIMGTSVADVRFRHRPVGLFDSAETVIIASTLFNFLVDDAGGFVHLDGRPMRFARVGPDEALLSLEVSGGDGVLALVQGTTGELLSVSAQYPIVERFVVSDRPGDRLTVGVDALNLWWLTKWTDEEGVLRPERTRLLAAEVTGGATDAAGTTYLVATVVAASKAETVLVRVGVDGVLERVWAPDEDGHAPAGPITISPGPSPVVVLGLADGDLALFDLETATYRHHLMVSFGKIGALVPGLAPGKVLLTKPADGAVFQFDALADTVDWTVQVRGEPTALDVAADLDEVSVGNSEDNAVDIVTVSSGTWLGRISFELGLGSADDGPGGAVAAYSYDPALPERPYVINVLARSAGMVLVMDASSLELQTPLALADSSAPLRLVVTSDLRTLVVHRRELGLLEDEGERLVAEGLNTPLAVAPLPTGGVLLGTLSAVDSLEWSGDPAVLVRKGGVGLSPGASLAGVAVSGSQALVVWLTEKSYQAGFWDVAALGQGKGPSTTVTLPQGAGSWLGIVALEDGPATLFGQSSDGPLLFPWATLAAGSAGLPSVLKAPVAVGSTPDGRYVTWTSESAGEHLVRLLAYDPAYDPKTEAALQGWGTYRLAGKASGPTYDPSGQWLYAPLPKLDTISVLE